MSASPMSRICTATLQYDRQDAVFGSAESVTGTITINLINPNTKLLFVGLAVRGGSNVSWYEKFEVDNKIHAVEFANRRRYVDKESTLWGAKDNTDESFSDELDTQSALKFPFEVTLPDDCASSFEGGDTGHVRYGCEVYVKTNVGEGIVVRKPLTLVGCVNLRDDKLVKCWAKKRIVKDMPHNWCGFGDPDGDIVLDVSIPRLGYVCGEVIPIFAAIRNNTSRGIEATRAMLYQHVSFKGNMQGVKEGDDPIVNKVRAFSRLISMVCKEEIFPPGDRFVWQNEGVLIPPLPPKLFCPDIELSYSMVFEATAEGKSDKWTAQAQFPIMIGTFPTSLVYLPILSSASSKTAGREPIVAKLRKFKDVEATTAPSIFHKSDKYMPRYVFIKEPPKMDQDDDDDLTQRTDAETPVAESLL